MKTLILILGICLSVSLGAQDENGVYSFTLEEAKQFALENNQEVKNSELDIIAAKKKVWETTAIGLPQVNGTINYQHIPGEIQTINFGEQMGDLFGLLGIPADSIPDLGGGSPIAVENSITYGATLSQLVFSGEYIVGLQASKTYKQLSENNKINTELINKENVSNAYFSILVLEKNMENLEASLTNMTKLVDESKQMKMQGFLEDTDIKQLTLNLNRIRNVRNTIKRQIEISYLLFKIQLGLKPDDKIVLKDNLDQIILKVNKLDYDTSNFVLEDNISYKMLETQKELSKLSLRRVQSTYLPTISAFYQYQDKTEKADFDFTINHIIGVQVSIPIFSSGQRMAQVSQARIEFEKNGNTKDMMENNILLGSVQAVNQYNNAVENYLTEKMNADLSKEIYDKTEIKYKNGMVSSMDLTQANTQYLENYSNYITAVLELLSAKTNLDKIYSSL